MNAFANECIWSVHKLDHFCVILIFKGLGIQGLGRIASQVIPIISTDSKTHLNELVLPWWPLCTQVLGVHSVHSYDR